MSRNKAYEEIKNLPPPTTVLLEMDGGLVNSSSALYQAYCALLSKYGYEGTKTEFKQCAGLSPTDFIPLLCDQHGIKKSIAALLHEYVQILSRHYTPEMPLVVNVRQFLDHKPLPRLTLALISTSPKLLTKAFLQDTHLTNYFDVLVSFNVDEADLPLNIYRYALAQLNVVASETIAIVHSTTNLEKCLDLGIQTILLDPNGRTELMPMSEKRCLRAKNWDAIQQFFMLWNDIYHI